jgi:cytochrome c
MPGWTDGAYLANSASTMNATDCNRCHQSPPFSNPNYNHSGVTLAANACFSCHGHDGAGATHINGILEAQGGACNSCHDYDVDPVTQDWGKSPKAVEGWGAHATHISHLKAISGVTLSAAADAFGGAAYNKVCGVCHTKDTANHIMGGSPTRSITFSDNSVTYQFSALSGAPTYSGVAGVSSATTPKTCSNVSCHFQASPVWEGL